MTDINPDNHREPDWAALLDRLEAERKRNGKTWTEGQQRQLDELRTLLYETEEALTLYAKLDIEEGWTKLRALAEERHLLPRHPVASHTIKRYRIWPKVAVAAAIIIAVSFGAYFLNQQQNLPIQEEPMSMVADIEPGGNRAKLIFSDGKSITLREDQEGIAIRETSIAYIDGDPVSYGEIAEVSSVTLQVPRTGQYQVDLPDGTRVWLNSESALTYPMQFTEESRRVQLIGEAYFEVAHNPAQPFIVSTQTQEVTVLGTHFNIHAYTDEPTSRTTLIEGSVHVRLMNDDEGLILIPGEQAVSDYQTIQTVRADQDQVLAWKNGKFVFHGQDLASIMRQISRWYDVDVQFEQPALRQFKFGGTVSRENNLSTVLKAMENTGNITFDVYGNTVIVRNVYQKY